MLICKESLFWNKYSHEHGGMTRCRHVKVVVYSLKNMEWDDEKLSFLNLERVLLLRSVVTVFILSRLFASIVVD